MTDRCTEGAKLVGDLTAFVSSPNHTYQIFWINIVLQIKQVNVPVFVASASLFIGYLPVHRAIA